MEKQNPHKNQGLNRIIKAFGYSLSGLQAAFKGEAAFRQVILINIILIPFAIMLNITYMEKLFLIVVCLISLIVELFNSAIEATVDRISLEIHPLSKNAKDMGSACQFISLTIIFISFATILLNNFTL